jgi:methylation protein EvaC
MRYYLCKKGAHSKRESVKKQLGIEVEIGLDKLESYQKFEKNCELSKKNLVSILKDLKSKGKRVVGYAATSKSTTVLNYCGIGPDLIEFISDTTPIKQGKFSPGMHIPVKPYSEFKNAYPDYALLFAWNHSQEVFENEKDFVSKGGKWLVFVPEVKILN